MVEFGPGRGALTLALAASGAHVVAVERDPHMVQDLRRSLGRYPHADRIDLRLGDLRDFDLPGDTYRVVASPPFALTTELLGRLLDDPERGPRRTDLLLQWEVARKHAAEPARSLRSAAWAPWWSFELGERVPRTAFRPMPAVDAAWLTIRRRDPAVLPTWLAAGFSDVLRPHWGRKSSRRQRS